MHIGRHISTAGSLLNTFVTAERINADAMQLFTGNPRSWQPHAVDAAMAEAFRTRLKDSAVRVVASHMPYLPNVASPVPETWKKSVESLRSELAACNALGIQYVVMHLGSHMGKGTEAGMQNIVRAVKAVEGDIGRVMLLLENEAGHRNSMGCDMKELAEIYDRVGSKRIGFCLDTCHLFAYGYDVGKHEVLDRIDKELGFDKVPVLHLNDAREPLGSHLDRHDNIGFGHIGMDGFRELLGYDRIADKTLILETAPSDRITEKEEIQRVRDLAEGRLQKGGKGTKKQHSL